MEKQAADLLSAGFYQASVAANRLRLELVAVAYYKQVVKTLRKVEEPRERVGFGWVMAQILLFEEIDAATYKMLRRVYSRSSAIIHGGETNRAIARSVGREINAAIAALKGGAV